MSFVSVSKEAEIATITLNRGKVGWPASFRGGGAIPPQAESIVSARSIPGGIVPPISRGDGPQRLDLRH